MASRSKVPITVGIPVFNEETHIARAIRSAASQADHVLVYDNASADGTEHRCRHLALELSNVTYVRHAWNRGSFENFRSLLYAAQTERFMWLGSHDELSPGYVEQLSLALDRTPGAALAFAPVQHINEAGSPIRTYDYPWAGELASQSALRRVIAIIRWLGDCSLVHGIFDTQAARHAWFPRPCMGGDIVILARAAAYGRLVRVSGPRYIRRIREHDTRLEQMRRIDTERSEQGADDFGALWDGLQETLESIPISGFRERVFRLPLARAFLAQRRMRLAQHLWREHVAYLGRVAVTDLRSAIRGRSDASS